MNARQPFSPLSPSARHEEHGGLTPSGGFQERRGDRYYVIEDAQRMQAFFTCLVSASDHFLFASSNGALTCGRRNAGQSLFPYATEDKVRDGYTTTGPYTAFFVRGEGTCNLWEPFRASSARSYRVRRNLWKSARGDKLGFEEKNLDLGLSFYYEWAPSDRFGFLRHCELRNLDARTKKVSLLDGVQNLLPACVDQQMQLEFSCLLDAYKQSEHLGKRLVAYSLAARITDRAEPQEALRASTAFCIGLPAGRVLVSSEQVEIFLRGEEIRQEEFIRGRRCAYFVSAEINLAPSTEEEWQIIIDAERSQADVVGLLEMLNDPTNLEQIIQKDVQKGAQALTEIVAQTDGIQATDDEATTSHHFANVLFNDMRGGVFPSDYAVSTERFRGFVRNRNRRVWEEHADWLSSLPPEIGHADLLVRLLALEVPDLGRLGFEYLPLAFSRRHGDPSRPWNKFDIRVRDERGAMLLGYQGNWRDIFQNWEALCTSYPGYIESIIAKFVNASTVDGFNPYRMTDAGIDWEIPEPENPWAGIGYWGDHQIIYLLKLLELSRAHHPEALSDLLARPIFSYGNVPYRIKPYSSMRVNPRDTIEFDEARHSLALKRAEQFGADGKLLHTGDQEPPGVYHVHLLEKLLVTSLAKMANFVPGAGIWLNTQRPEWNDANNALVGSGVSMVTLYYLTRFFCFLEQIAPSISTDSVEMSQEVAEWLSDTLAILEQNLPTLGEPITDKGRCALVDALGHLFSDYRQKVYRGGFSTKVQLPTALVNKYLKTCRKHLEHSLQGGKRTDGLFHAYNLIRFEGDELIVEPLYEMLEGQVAVLSSGALGPSEAVDLLDSLRASAMYRADQNSYMLYPNRQLPRFLDKNRIPEEALQSAPLLAQLAHQKNSILDRDAQGTYRFAPDLFNAKKLREALVALVGPPSEDQIAQALEVYEQVFQHHFFTGRSGTMFAYEGLGSIYWHMVAKLLLAVQENYFRAEAQGASKHILRRLGEHYYAIREGLGGFNKSPEVYGAFPPDPYSHTPESSPARQPGMTGQVKEEILTRMGELGVRVQNGTVRFAPSLLRCREFLKEPREALVIAVGKKSERVYVPAESLLFTYCQVPVIYRLGRTASLRVTFRSGVVHEIAGDELPREVAASIFQREGEVARIESWVFPTFD